MVSVPPGWSMAERRGGVQSIGRAFEILESIAGAGGVSSLSDLARESGLPLSSIHRLVRTLVELGYVRQESSRRYALGPRLIRLGEASSKVIGIRAKPYLAHLADELGESANLAMLDGDEVVYIGQAQSTRSVRMFTEVGGRVLPHSTAVGKAIMAQMSEDEVRAILSRTGMPRSTETTITDPDMFVTQLAEIREQHYAVDEGENEEGVRCFAAAVPTDASRMAVSVSGPAGRVSEELLIRAVPLLLDACRAIAKELA
jgi:IclR family transcriptional regulator, acetate operon repressor